MENAKRMIVISLDAVGGMDEAYLRTLPHFKAFMDGAAICTNVKSVYPSITYPAHTSIVTGRHPKNHGVINNTFLQPNRQSPDWYWQRKYIQGTTLYDEAIKKGMRVAALLWPVTAKSAIQYNMPEIFANRPWSNQITTSLFNGTPSYQAVLNAKFGHLRDGKRQPQLDNFVHESLLYTLEKYRPDLTLVHFTDVDTNRHIHGVHSKEAREAMARHDKRLGEIFELLHRLNMAEDTNIIILGDHYQKDVEKIIYLNHVLVSHGYMTVENDKVTDWKAICKNCDGSAYIYLKKGFGHLHDELYNLIKDVSAREDSGIERVYTHTEAVQKGADRQCALMVEAKDGCYFLDSWRVFSENVQAESDELDSEGLRAVHGYDPEKEDYATIFMAKGPDIAPDVSVEKMRLIDEGPTMAKLLGLELMEADGKAIDAFLRCPKQGG